MRALSFSHISAQALVPEQLVHYVRAVGESEPFVAGECLGYALGGNRVLVGYPGAAQDFLRAPFDGAGCAAIADDAVGRVCEAGAVNDVTVLAPLRPGRVPENAVRAEDEYWFLPLPLPRPPVKTRNMLLRAGRECTVAAETWSAEHAAMVADHDGRRGSGDAERHIHARLPQYLASSPDVLLFAARTGEGRLAAFCIGDFTGLVTAFYLFAFRSPTAPPGSADLALAALAAEGEARGHALLNLGLGINEGVRFFKKKWGAVPALPYVECSWNIRSAAARPVVGPGKEATAEDPLAAVPGPAFGLRFRDFLRGGRRELECIQVEVTSRCPARCTYCPHTTKAAAWKARNLEPAAFAALAPLFGKLERVHLQGWGEPLLHPRFLDMAHLARRYGCAVSTTTCGLGMTENMAAGIVGAGFDIVAFSLAGCTEESNAPRAGAPLSGVVEGISRLRRAREASGRGRPAIHLAYIMLASNMEDVTQLPSFMAETGADAAVVSTMDYIAAPGMEQEAFSPTDTEKLAKARPLLEEARLDAEARGLHLHYALPSSRPAHECREHISRSLYMDAEGELSPCIYVNLPTTEDDPCRRAFGNVLRTPPFAIWNSPAFTAFRTRLAAGDPDLPCQSCPKRFEEE